MSTEIGSEHAFEVSGVTANVGSQNDPVNSRAGFGTVRPTPARPASRSSTPLHILVRLAALCVPAVPRLAQAMSVPIDLCVAADVAVVARAVRTYSYSKSESSVQPLPPRTVTDVDFATEHVYFGLVPPFLTRTFAGGRLNGVTTFNSGSPFVEVGERYLLVYQERSAPGDLRLLLARYVGDAVARVPSVWESHTWTRLCSEHPEGIFVGSQVKVDGVEDTVGNR